MVSDPRARTLCREGVENHNQSFSSHTSVHHDVLGTASMSDASGQVLTRRSLKGTMTKSLRLSCHHSADFQGLETRGLRWRHGVAGPEVWGI
jgi:hypothetical protein